MISLWVANLAKKLQTSDCFSFFQRSVAQTTMRTKLPMAPMFDNVCVVQTTSLRQARFPALAKNFGVLRISVCWG